MAVTRDATAFTHAATGTGGVALIAGSWSLAAAAVVWIVNRRPGVIGPLLMAAGAAWPLGEWGSPGSGSDVIFTVGQVAFALCPPLVIWITLAYPVGTLGTAASRGVVISGFAVFVGLLGAAPALFFDPADEFCSQCPRNLVLVHADPEIADRVSTLGFRVAAIIAAVAAAVAVGRVVAGDRPGGGRPGR